MQVVLTTVIQASYTAYVDVWWQKIRPRIESISQPSSTPSPYRTSTSERTDHVVTGMEKLQDAKNTIRHINLQRNAVKRDTKASTTGSSATRPSERRWLKSVAPNKWSSRWTSLRMRTTLTKPARKKSSSTVAIGASTQRWHTLIQYPQGTNPNLKVRCQQCSAWSEQRTKRSKKHWHKPLHPRLLGTGIQAGGSLILSTHLKNGMTADNTGEPVIWWLNIYLREESQRAEEFGIFIVKIGYSWRQSTVTDGRCKGNVSCTSYSRTFGYGKLRTSSRTTWTTWSTLRTMARTPQSTLTCTMRSSEHAAHRLLMHSVHTSHLWLKVSPCVSFLFIHACALVSCLLSGLSSPVSLLPRQVPLPALPGVHPGAWWDLH